MANNSIASLKELPFSCRSCSDKLAIKHLQPPRPNLYIKQVCKKAGKTYFRGFSRTWYLRKTWLAGCKVTNALFCYPVYSFTLAPARTPPGQPRVSLICIIYRSGWGNTKRRWRTSIAAWNSRASEESTSQSSWMCATGQLRVVTTTRWARIGASSAKSWYAKTIKMHIICIVTLTSWT